MMLVTLKDPSFPPPINFNGWGMKFAASLATSHSHASGTNMLSLMLVMCADCVTCMLGNLILVPLHVLFVVPTADHRSKFSEGVQL